MRYRVFAVLLTLLMLSFFFVPELQQRNWLLYLTALSGHAFMGSALSWRRAFADTRGLALLILLGFPLLSLAWSTGTATDDVRELFVAGYCIFTIYFGMVQLVAASPRDVERLKSVLLIAAAIASALSIGHWLVTDQAGVWRLSGVLGLHNPVHASILVLAATLPALRRIAPDRAGLGWFAACVLPWLFVLLAGARAALGAYLLVVVWLLARRQSFRTNVAVGGIAVVFIAAMFALVGTEVFQDIWMARGLSHRDEIWSQVWAQFRGCNPLVGCGIGSPLSITMGTLESSRPHSIILGVLYYQGVLGVLAFGAALGYLMLSTLREAGGDAVDRNDWVVLLGFALLANLTSGDHIIVRATLFWSYFWLPVLVLAARRPAASGTENSP